MAERQQPIYGMQAIADYMEADESTIRRWHKKRPIPLRRPVPGSTKIFAYPAELDAWKAQAVPYDATPVEPQTAPPMIPLSTPRSDIVIELDSRR